MGDVCEGTFDILFWVWVKWCDGWLAVGCSSEHFSTGRLLAPSCSVSREEANTNTKCRDKYQSRTPVRLVVAIMLRTCGAMGGCVAGAEMRVV